MKQSAVIGLGFGDEGKGRVTSLYCSTFKPGLVVRFSGGQQAGHNVIVDGTSHVFSNFGSGTLNGVPTYFSKYCTIDPVGILNEFYILKDKGVDPVLYIDKKCPVTTPYDKLFNNSSIETKLHGTCGVGFGATHEREDKRYSLLFEDLFDPIILKIKFKLIKDYYNFSHATLSKAFIDNCAELINLKNIKIPDADMPYNPNGVVFEGSQGLLLDQDIGFFPHVTRSNVGSKNIVSMGAYPELYLVTRAYQTRHGNGPMTNENLKHNIKINKSEQNFDDGCQGMFRRSLLDLNLLKYAISKDNFISKAPNRTLVITCLDHLEEFKLTIDGEVKNHDTEDEFVKTIKTYLGFKDIILSRSNNGEVENYK